MHRFAAFTACATFVLLIAGGMVTSTDSGLAVPDWPLSYGMWFPPMVGGIFYEHGHRMVAAVVGLLILVLAVWLARREPRRWVRRLGYAAVGAVFAQALLGGLTVLWLLPPQISIAHACLGQVVFCLIVSLAWCTAPPQKECYALWSEVDARPTTSRLSALPSPTQLRWVPGLGRGHAVATAVAAASQLLLGAVIRHTGLAAIPHILGAVVLVGLAIAFAWRVRRDTILRVHAWRLLGLLAVQVGLGLSVLSDRTQPLLRTSHVALGALVLAQTVITVWEAYARTTRIAIS